MGSNGGKDIKISGNDAAECSETTVEIKIKTLDSQTYTLRVNKYVPVSELKKQIASVTGVLSEQQRLICRGKVLEDDQLLSAYYVEDGHTLHLVTRQPVVPSSDSSLIQSAADPPSSTGHNLYNRLRTGIVVRPSNRVGPFSDPSSIVAVLRTSFRVGRVGPGVVVINPNIVAVLRTSFRVGRVGPGVVVINPNHPSEPPLNVLGLAVLRNSRNQQPDQAASMYIPSESQEPSVIPDSLTTLSQFLDNLRLRFLRRGGRQGANSRNSGIHGNHRHDLNADMHSSEQRGLRTPESLAELMLSTRQIIIEQGTESLSQLARQLQGQSSVTHVLERFGIQVDALTSANLFQDLGTSLLELGRIIMTLQMGATPTDAVVNAGPSVFLSSTGHSLLSVHVPIPIGIIQRRSRFSGGSPASDSLQPREPSSSQPQEVVVRVPLPSNGNSDQQDAAGLDLSSSTWESQSQNVSSSQEAAAATVSDEGIFLSNVLRQVLPIISENIGAEPNLLSREGANSVETQADGNQNQPASSRRRRRRQPHDTQSLPSSKRCRR